MLSLGRNHNGIVPATRQQAERDLRPQDERNSLCAALEGFTLHAAVRVEEGQRDRLEHMCRYISRPPLSSQRLSRSRSGKVVLELRHAWRDGTTHISFSPLVFIERLAAGSSS